LRHAITRLARPSILLPVIGLAAACASGPAPSQAARSGHQRHDKAVLRGDASAAARPRSVLQIKLAPFRLRPAVSGEAVSADAGHLLIAGGLLADQSSSGSVIRIDLRTGRSAVAGHLAISVHDAASAVLGGRLLVFGGGTQVSGASVQRPAPRGGTVYGALPAPRSDLLAVTHGPTIYLAGGHGISAYDRSVLATTDGRHFRVVARLRLPVRYPAVVLAGADLWIFGGLTPGGPASAVQRVDLRTGRTRLECRLPRPLAAASAFSLGGAIYVVGGLTSGSSDRAGGSPPLITSSAVLRFDPAGPSFAAAGRLPVPDAHSAVAVAGGVAYLVGGLDGSRTLGAVTTFRLIRRPVSRTPARRG
jgi:hypothetical protein